MSNLSQFEKDFKAHLENIFNSSKEEDNIKKLAETENTVTNYIDQYIENYDLKRIDIVNIANFTLEEFGRKKINYIE